MSRYFTAHIEGVCPDGMDEAELQERLNEVLPSRSEADVRRLDDPDGESNDA